RRENTRAPSTQTEYLFREGPWPNGSKPSRRKLGESVSAEVVWVTAAAGRGHPRRFAHERRQRNPHADTQGAQSIRNLFLRPPAGWQAASIVRDVTPCGSKELLRQQPACQGGAKVGTLAGRLTCRTLGGPSADGPGGQAEGFGLVPDQSCA